MTDPRDAKRDDALLLTEAELILAEKRTSLSVLRTGIAVIALPMTILSFLIATSRSYAVTEVLHWLVPLLVLCGLLVVLGVYLAVRSLIRIRRYDRILAELKSRSRELARLLD
ncbi:MAG: hypothetical protein KDC38_07695 [Planctomycetes bacterium]|nr:hypothetical protein [Planctomycetota bacterium]